MVLTRGVYLSGEPTIEFEALPRRSCGEIRRARRRSTNPDAGSRRGGQRLAVATEPGQHPPAPDPGLCVLRIFRDDRIIGSERLGQLVGPGEREREAQHRLATCIPGESSACQDLPVDRDRLRRPFRKRQLRCVFQREFVAPCGRDGDRPREKVCGLAILILRRRPAGCAGERLGKIPPRVSVAWFERENALSGGNRLPIGFAPQERQSPPATGGRHLLLR
jgi:hypothetical protein